MSESEQDIFKRLEQEFLGAVLPEMPPDPVQEILLKSTNPFDGAKKLYEYAETLSDEETERVVRKGTDALRAKHYLEFSDPAKSLEVLVTNCYAYPEENPALRVRNTTKRLHLTGYTFVRGTFGNIVSLKTIDDEGERIRYTPAIIMRNPVVLDEFSRPSAEVSLPDYLFFSISAVYNDKYAFTEGELDT